MSRTQRATFARASGRIELLAWQNGENPALRERDLQRNSAARRCVQSRAQAIGRQSNPPEPVMRHVRPLLLAMVFAAAVLGTIVALNFISGEKQVRQELI